MTAYWVLEAGMTYKRFEDLPVWQTAIELAVRVDQLTRNATFRRPGDLDDQLARASLSISNNIAEGFERGSTNELLMFIYIARGSAGEVRSMLRYCQTHRDFQHLRSQISDLISKSESCSRQLRGWADSLQNSDIKGQRHLNDASRERWMRKQRADAFMAKINRMVEDGRRSRGEIE
jgi:four helix bundle protein